MGTCLFAKHSSWRVLFQHIHFFVKTNVEIILKLSVLGESTNTQSDRKPLRSCRFQQNVYLFSGGLIREDKFLRHSRFHPGIGPHKILHLCGISGEDEGRTVTCGVVPTFDGGHNCFHSLVAEVLFGVASETVGLIKQQRAACSLITISLVFTADPQITSATNSSLCMTVR